MMIYGAVYNWKSQAHSFSHFFGGIEGIIYFWKILFGDSLAIIFNLTYQKITKISKQEGLN